MTKNQLSIEDYKICSKLKSMRFSGMADALEEVLADPNAELDETIYNPKRQLDVHIIEELSKCEWIEQGKNLVITGKPVPVKATLPMRFVFVPCASSRQPDT